MATRALGLPAESLPFPLAATAHKLEVALASDRDSFRRLALLKDCVEAYVKYLVTVLAGLHAERAPPRELDSWLLARLARPSFGVWVNELLENLARQAHSVEDRRISLGLERRLRERAAGRTVLDALKRFVVVRNEILGHGAVRSEDVHYHELLDRWIPAYVEIVGAIEEVLEWGLVGLRDAACWQGWDPRSAGAGPLGVRIAGSRTVPLGALLNAIPVDERHVACCFYDALRAYRPEKGKRSAIVLDYASGRKLETDLPVLELETAFGADVVARSYRVSVKTEVDRFAEVREAFLEQAVRLVDRPWARDTLEGLRRTADRGVLAVGGPIGTGKSTLLAQLARATGGASFFFGLGGPTSIDDAARSLLLQLGAAPEEVPPTPAERLQLLEELLCARTDACVVVLDAADEVTGGAERLLSLFPAPWPCGLFVVISSRSSPGWHALLAALRPEVTVQLVDLAADEVRLVDDAISVARSLGIDDHEAARRAAREASNNLLVLTTGATSGGGDRVHAAFERAFARVFASLVPTEEAATREILALLATAREPVGPWELAAAASCPALEVEHALIRLGPFLLRGATDDSDRVRVFHPAARAFLDSRLRAELEGAHVAWAGLGAAERASAYGLRHAPSHLVLASRRGAALELLTRPEFVARRLEQGMLDLELSDLNHLLAGELNRGERVLAAAWKEFLLRESDLVEKAGSTALAQRALEAGASSAVASAVRAWLAIEEPTAFQVDLRAEPSHAAVRKRVTSNGAVRVVLAEHAPGRVLFADGEGASIWDPPTAQISASVRCGSRVTAACWLEPGRRACLGTASGNVGGWSLRDDALDWCCTGLGSSVAALATGRGDSVLVGLASGVVLIIESAPDRAPSRLGDHGAPIVAMARVGDDAISVGRDGRLVYWSLLERGTRREHRAPKRPVTAACQSTDSEALVIAAGRGEIYRMDVEGRFEPIASIGSTISALAERDGEIAAGTSAGTVALVDWDGARLIARQPGEIHAVASVGIGELAVAGEHARVEILDAAGAAGSSQGEIVDAELLGDELYTLHVGGAIVASSCDRQKVVASHGAAGAALIALPDGSLASTGEDGCVRHFRPSSRPGEHRAPGPGEMLVVSGDGIVVYTREPACLRHVDLRGGLSRDFPAPPDLAFITGNGASMLAGIDASGGVWVWNLSDGDPARVRDLPGPAAAAAFLADGTLAVVSTDGSAIELDGELRELVRHRPTGATPCGIESLSGGRWAVLDASGSVGVRADHRALASFTTGRAETLGSVCDPRGKLLIFDANGISRWDPSGSQVWMRELSARPIAVEARPRDAIVALEDGSVRWLALESGEDVSCWFGREPCRFLRASGQRVWAAERWGAVHLLAPFEA